MKPNSNNGDDAGGVEQERNQSCKTETNVGAAKPNGNAAPISASSSPVGMAINEIHVRLYTYSFD